ncbi:MAG: hypothetical protein GWO07_04860 [Candidatus Dadabacteria bacterium]|nr:hypothetical protein [Candidatus Dadabacteria bacterium]NIV41192.1 hypothetical protein [Candidatus Dadabacteria bacterium]NIX14481.1 hypothetical protein [Candidatus Dadabacteria bacterium]
MHPRVEIREDVMFGQDKPDRSGRSENLSPGGICIISDSCLPQGSSIVIDISVKHTVTDGRETWENITVYGKVVWLDSPPGTYHKMGVEFSRRNEKLHRIYELKKSDL